MRITLFLTVLILTRAIFAQNAVLIEDPLSPASDAKSGGWSLFSNKQKASETPRPISFTNLYELRAKKRVGVGISTAGQLGLVGFTAELNFAVDDSAVVGFGTGGAYNSITGQWKHTFSAGKIAPYTTLGYSRWYGNGQGGDVNKTSPGFLSQKFLSDSEKITGKFGKDLFIPSAGLQYYLLSGPYVGASVFVEVMLIINASNLDSAPTGSLGMAYYF
jgi:hypothetical protein